MQILHTSPFIEGVGYFMEVTTTRGFSPEEMAAWDAMVKENVCGHSSVTSEVDNGLGLDFHEHIPLRDPEDKTMEFVEHMLLSIEASHGIDHLCVEFQFNLARAKATDAQIQDLLQP